LFSDVRSFEALEQLHVGMLSPIERKTRGCHCRSSGIS